MARRVALLTCPLALLCLGAAALTWANVEEPLPFAAPVPLSEDEPTKAESTAEADILRRLSMAEGLLRLGKHEAASRLAADLPTTGTHRDATLRLRAWAHFHAGAYVELEQLLAGEDALSGELAFLRGTARWRAGRAEGVAELRALWWGEPASAWGLAAARELAEPPPDTAPVYDTRSNEVLRRSVPSPTIDTALGGGEAESRLVALARTTKRRGQLAAEVQHALGVAALRGERFSEAAAAFHRALRCANPELTRVIELRLGEAERRRGRYEAAQRHFTRVAAAAADRFGTEALALAGQMAIEFRRYPDARRLFEAQLVHNPVGPARHAALWGLGWVAFRTGDFVTASRFFSTLQAESPYGELAPRALYWWARALEERGANVEAVQLLASLERCFPVDYYAYRARQRRGATPLGPEHNAPEVSTPMIDRVRSLLHNGMTLRARAELAQLRATTGELGPEALALLEQAADEAGAPELARGFRAARWQRFPSSDEALAVHQGRFPEIYVAKLRRAATAQRIPEDLPAALVRQESGFRARAVSPVGALGLMQLMPATGRELWHEERKRGAPSTEELLDPEHNIRLGVRYLGRMLRAFGRRTEYALAAYNAGPGAVTRWRQARGDLPEDIFVEEIPYAETRDYVRRVLANAQTLWLIAAGPAALVPPAPLVAIAGPPSELAGP